MRPSESGESDHTFPNSGNVADKLRPVIIEGDLQHALALEAYGEGR